jgi:hypothetical protein
MDILTGVAILLLVVVIAFLYYRQTEKFTVVGKFIEPIPTNKGMSFTQVPVDKTYIFADPIPDTATSFDRILSRFVDKNAPASVAKTTFPESAPYNDSEVERIAKLVLARVKGSDTPKLDFISVEYAAKGVDAAKNIHYDLTIICYDRIKNYSLKLVIVCVLDPKSKLWVKKFASFNSFVPDTKGPLGVASVEELLPVDFVPDFTSYQSLYV